MTRPGVMDDEPPLCGCGGGAGEEFMEYDEDGSLALARALADIRGASRAPGAEGARDAAQKPCPVSSLNGSWYLQMTPRGPHTLVEIRGPMRIEVAAPRLRVSGDVYVRKPTGFTGPVEVLKPITDKPLLFGKNWYPHLPFAQYSWYFRSVGVTYQKGSLVFKFERHLWNPVKNEFIKNDNTGKDTGFMRLECVENTFTHPSLPQPTLRMTGTAQVGGETYDVVATKTSPFYRGCAVEVDAMTNRAFPLSATAADGTAVSFASVYRTAGMDCLVRVDRTDLANDPQLTSIELQTALATNRRATDREVWRLWLLVGSAQGSLFGLMFDDVEPFREGTAGFFDPKFASGPTLSPDAHGKKLGDVPAAFLRTLVHEAGHAFNLFHPKHDVHAVPLGTTIMNQTGDVMGFATADTPYPANITFAFDDHNRTSLIHSPDPQVAPGWKRFGWGHGSLSSGITEPVDAAGLLADGPAAVAEGLMLELHVPDTVFRGQFITAQFVLTNRGTEARRVTAALNLSQGDLRLLVSPPAEELHDVRDVILACGDRAYVTLQPGESLTGNGQIFYTNLGHTFRQTGRYLVSAELHVGDALGTTVASRPMPVVVRAPLGGEEEAIARLSMELGVGRAFAFGDYGLDAEAKAHLEVLARDFGHTETGAAAALTLANAQQRDLRDLRTAGGVLRPAEPKTAEKHFKKAAAGHAPGALVRLATGVAAPTEADAPVLQRMALYLKDRPAMATDAATLAGAPAKRGAPAKPGATAKRGARAKAPAAAVADGAGGLGSDASADAVPDASTGQDALDLLTRIRSSFAPGA